MSKAEKFIQDYTRNCSNEIAHWDIGDENIKPIYSPWLTPDQARRAVEIAREEIFEWLINHSDYIITNGRITRFDMEKCVKDLKKAMKDE